MFYRAVVQAVLLYSLETWVISTAMENKVEGINTEFLRHIMEKRVQRVGDRTWEILGAEGI